MQKRDRLKVAKAMENGVKLVLIPEIKNILDFNTIKQTFIEKFEYEGLSFDKSRFCTLTVDLKTSNAKRMFLRLSEAAEAEGGKLLSSSYLGYGEHLFSCATHGKFKQHSNAVLQGRWCKKCGHASTNLKKKKGTLEEAKLYAKKQGGRLLSTNYEGQSYSLKWKCKSGHEFSTSMRNLKAKKHTINWCAVCARVEKFSKAAIRQAKRVCRAAGYQLHTTHLSRITKVMLDVTCSRCETRSEKKFETIKQSRCGTCLKLGYFR